MRNMVGIVSYPAEFGLAMRRTAIEILRRSFSADDESPLFGAVPNTTANLLGQDVIAKEFSLKGATVTHIVGCTIEEPFRWSSSASRSKDCVWGRTSYSR
jgi:hypothetical protein